MCIKSKRRKIFSAVMKSKIKVWPGKPSPLGATWQRDGVNFALTSEHAAGVDLCLFDSPDATTESCRIKLTEKTGHTWHCFVPDLKPGQVYGYRVQGRYEPKNGQRFNPRQTHSRSVRAPLLARLHGGPDMLPYDVGGTEDLSVSRTDNAGSMIERGRHRSRIRLG